MNEMKETREVLEKLAVDPSVGVLESDVERRREEFGSNRIEPKKQHGILWYFFNDLKNPLNLILIGAGILTLFLGEHLDMYVIFAAVLVNVFISVFQESRTNKTFQKLNKSKAFDVLLRRDGKKMVLQAEELVLGDIIFLQAGNKIPADLTIIEGSDLFVDESSFTGEAENVEKKPGNLAFSGSIVKRGSAVGIATAVGERSEFGQILAELNDIEKKPSAIAEKMKRLSMFVGYIAVFAIILVVIAGVYSGLPFYSLIVLGISVAVSAIPEGLGASVSAALSVGMHRLLKKGIFVKDLVSTETMASVDTILTDKTGTLTEGNMTLKEIFVNESENISQENFIEYAYLASDSSYDFKHQQFVGDEMDIAIAKELERTHLQSSGEYYQEIEDRFETIKIFPFSSENKFFARLAREKATNEIFVFVKGAPEVIIADSSNLSDADTKKYQEILKTKQDANSRFLAFGYKKVYGEDLASIKLDLENTQFIGLGSFLDPLKKSVKEVLQSVKDMELNLIMITGDAKEIASAVALKSGLISYGEAQVLEGKDIENMSKDEIYLATETVKVFARVSPKHKLKLAETFVERGHRIAMTGDGVNDVLALSQADIGITFVNASEAARESASLVLRKNDFSLILLAVD